MARPTIEAITDATLDEFAALLHQQLNASRSAALWAADFRRCMRPESPNYGFALRDNGHLVGGIGALYADRTVAGRRERYCNITSWCVLPDYRQHSTRLAMALLAQGERVYTDFSPTKVVAATLRFLKFTELDERRAVSLNLPGLGCGVRVLTRHEQIAAALPADARAAYDAHRQLPWLHHLALVEGDGAACHVIYRRSRIKGLPAAHVLHVGDAAVYRRGRAALARHFWRRGLPFSVVELRTVAAPPKPYLLQTGFTRKVVLAPADAFSNVDYLYSETLLFDLT